MTQYIVFEGTEGVGKTSLTKLLVEYLQNKGYKVLQTKEPGIALLPLTMKLREIMLSSEFESQLTVTARELISQAIRSIHLEKLIYPNLNKNSSEQVGNYDFIIQDRGILSGLAYGEACDNNINFLTELTEIVTKNKNFYSLYDKVIYLKGDSKKSLQRAINSKQEYTAGDAIEAKGSEFMENVSILMESHLSKFNCATIYIDNKDIPSVFDEVKQILKI